MQECRDVILKNITEKIDSCFYALGEMAYQSQGEHSAFKILINIISKTHYAKLFTEKTQPKV
jgi:hypothetical protein